MSTQNRGFSAQIRFVWTGRWLTKSRAVGTTESAFFGHNVDVIAEIVSVGTELLMGQIPDTHAQSIGRLLPQFGLVHRWRQTVGDNVSRIAEAVALALSRSDVVFTIGGLGPTEDDVTREGIALALGDDLVFESVVAEQLRRLFAQRNIPWVESQLAQAYRPESARLIENPFGSAPGLCSEKNGKLLIALPGPRGEFGPMLEGPVSQILAGLQTGFTLSSRLLKLCGVGESMVEESIRDLIHASNPTVGIYASPGEVHLRLTARGGTKADADALLGPLEAEIRNRMGAAVFGSDQDTLESVVLDLLRSRRLKLAVAESCTGGGLGARLTSVPGSSDVFVGGVISYSNDVKHKLLGVSEQILLQHGAVSEPCAIAMAQGACVAAESDMGISITGIAGPEGGTPSKPVGTVWIASTGLGGTHTRDFKFRGTREDIRRRSTQAALTLLREHLLGTA